MSSGKVHLIANVIGGVALTAAAVIYAPQDARAIGLGCACGCILSPDLDQEGRTLSESLFYVIPPLGWAWRLAWFGYAMIFKHRGMSHVPVIGTLTRAAWLLLIVAVLVILIHGLAELAGYAFLAPQAALPVVVAWLAQPALLCAWAVQDVLHAILDL